MGNRTSELAERLVLEREFKKNMDTIRFSVPFSDFVNKRLEVMAGLLGHKKIHLVSMAAEAFLQDLEEELGFRDVHGKVYQDLIWNNAKTVEEIIEELEDVVNG